MAMRGTVALRGARGQLATHKAIAAKRHLKINVYLEKHFLVYEDNTEAVL
jgi:hypothetical protein